MIRKLIDRFQVWLYLAGFMGLASVIGRFGTPAKGSLSECADDIHDRPTLPCPVYVNSQRSGPGWSLDEDPPKPLRIVKFDATFRNSANCNMLEVEFPKADGSNVN